MPPPPVVFPGLLDATPEFTALIGTVQGDLHDIGKNLVAIMWKGANFKVIDLGANVTPARYIAAIQEPRLRFSRRRSRFQLPTFNFQPYKSG